MKLVFKNQKLQGVLKHTKEGKQFLIPYEGDKTKSNPTIWLVKDSGIYVMTSVPRGKSHRGQDHICYAEGYGPKIFISGDDFVEEIDFGPGCWKYLDEGYDLVIELTRNTLKVIFSKNKKP